MIHTTAYRHMTYPYMYPTAYQYMIGSKSVSIHDTSTNNWHKRILPTFVIAPRITRRFAPRFIITLVFHLIMNCNCFEGEGFKDCHSTFFCAVAMCLTMSCIM